MRKNIQRVDFRQESGFDPKQSLPQQKFLRLLAEEQLDEPVVLDIGAGRKPNRFLLETFGDHCVVDGVDIDPERPQQLATP